MSVKNTLIVGSGDITFKHKEALRKISKKIKIFTISSRKFNQNFLNNNLYFDYIIICSPATNHYDHLNLIEKNFDKIRVLIEKPVFEEYKNIKFTLLKNKYFVGYNLRFHPVIRYLKNYLKGKKVHFIDVNCSSYLPNWRKGINYSGSVSSLKKLGGGVLLELSHEIDYLLWFFKKIKILNVFNKKISNLKINTDDILLLNGYIKKKTIVNLSINFFSRINRREIFVDGKNFSLKANILNNTISILEGEKKRLIKFKKFKMRETYKLENFNIIKKNYKDICSLQEGLYLLKLIELIKKKNEN